MNVLERNREYAYTYEVEFAEPKFHVGFGMLLKTTIGYELGGAGTGETPQCLDFVPACAGALKVRFRFRPFWPRELIFSTPA